MTESEGADVKARIKGTSSMADFASTPFIIEVGTKSVVSEMRLFLCSTALTF
jgi:hypothetical protein